MKELQGALYYLAAWFALAVLAAPAVAAAWWIHRRSYRSLWPPQRQRLVPWSGAEIGAALLLWMLGPALFGQALEALGLYQWLYGPDFPAAPKPGSAEAVRWALLAQTLASPLLLAALLVFFRLASGTRPYQLGLTGHRLAGNLVLGYGVWLLLTPLVNGVNLLAVLGTRLVGRPADEHVLVRVIQSQGNRLDWVLAALVALVLAPVLEEMLFRGILQPWLARRTWGGPAAAVTAFLLALPEAAEKQALALPLFVIILTPGLFYVERLAWRWLPVPNAAATIYGTSLLFATLHGDVWPSPIPLFVLSLGLGYLAYRTQGLAAPIVTHALFNGVTVALLFFPQVTETNGKETTSVGRRPVAVSTSSLVPGSRLPRRT